MKGTVIPMAAPALTRNTGALAAQAARILTAKGRNAPEALCEIIAEAQFIPNPDYVEPTMDEIDAALEEVGIERVLERFSPQFIQDPRRVEERITARLSKIIDGKSQPKQRL